MCFIASQLEKDHLFFACCMAPYEIIRTERRAFSRSQIALGIVETYLQPAGTQGNVNPVSCPCVSLPLCDKPDAQTRNDHGVNRVGAFLLQVKCRRELASSTLDKPSDPSIWGQASSGLSRYLQKWQISFSISGIPAPSKSISTLHRVSAHIAQALQQPQRGLCLMEKVTNCMKIDTGLGKLDSF